MSLLMAPGVTIMRDSSTVPPTVLVDVTAPGFEPGRSSLNVLATVGTEYRMSPAERATAIRNGFTDVSAMESWTAGAQAPLKLLEWSPRYAEDGLTQIGNRYRYIWAELTRLHDETQAALDGALTPLKAQSKAIIDGVVEDRRHVIHETSSTPGTASWLWPKSTSASMNAGRE